MDRERISSALARALDLARRTTRFPAEIFWEPTLPPDGLDELEECLRDQEDLRIFENRELWFFSIGCGNVNHRDLALWLTARAFRLHSQLKDDVSAVEDTVENLHQFLGTTTIPILTVAAVSGVTPESPISLSDQLTLLRFDGLPPSRMRRDRLSVLGSLAPRPEAALMKGELLTRTGEEAGNRKVTYHRDDSEFREACRIITIVGICAPRILSIWEQTEDWVPCGDRLYRSHILWGGHPFPYRTEILSDEKGRLVRALWDRYASVPEPTKRTLRMSIDRLNLALGNMIISNSAIELGISLEALLLADRQPDRGEQTLTLRLRAARLLGSDVDSRRQVSLLIRNVYAIRSEAVHTGTVDIDKPMNGEPKLSLLSRGHWVAAEANRKIIEAGALPDWETLLYE